jgi:hypothetical protein
LGGSENETKKNFVFLVSIHQENKNEEIKRKTQITLYKLTLKLFFLSIFPSKNNNYFENVKYKGS